VSDTPQPPPPGGQPPPPGGQPPPPGGQPPPPGSQPPPPGGPPPPAAGGEPYSVGNAFNYGWQKFQQNLGPILLGLLAYVVALMIVSMIWFFITNALFASSSEAQFEAMLTGRSAGPTIIGGLLLFGVQALVGFIGFVIIQAAVTRAALAITDGRSIELQTLFAFDNIGQLVIGALVVGLATSIGSMLCYIPGLIVMFFSQFYVHFLLDRNLGAIDAIKASFSFVNANLGTLVGFFLASLVAYILGALLCGIGLLFAVPVVIIAQAYTYRRLLGEPIAP